MIDEFEELLGGPSPVPAAPPVRVLVPTGAGGERAMGAFEGADRLNSSIALWDSPLQSVDLDVLPEKVVIDGRSRDMLRNDAYVQNGANLHKNNIVGAHYLLNCRPATRVLRGAEDETWEEEFQEEVEAKWELYADSPDCWIDAQRQNTFTELVRMAVGIDLMGGEVLSTVEWVTDDASPYATALQMIDLDRLSPPQDQGGWQEWLNPNQRAGIVYNNRGAPQSYFIRTTHPNDFGPVGMELPKWKQADKRKPWGRMQVFHLFEQTRPDQSRGVTELAASLSVMKKSHTWRDINIQHAAAQAAVMAAITSELPHADIMTRMGVGDSPAAVEAAVSAWCQGYLGSVAAYVGTKGIALDGVRVPRLYPGEKLEFKTPASGPLGTEFEASMNRYIAASVGVSYEEYTGDYTNTNYSSSRAAGANTEKYMAARKKRTADRFATGSFRLWLEEAINAGNIETAKGIKIYDPVPGQRYGRLNTNFDALSRCDWVGASRGQIDELKETQAAVLRISNGLSTAEDELARLGKDWRKVYRQLKREMAMRETLGLAFMATDPATMAAMSALSATPSDTGKEPRGNPNKGSK